MTIEEAVVFVNEMINETMDGDGIVRWDRVDENGIGIEMADGSLFLISVQAV